jgi:transcriptional regulator with XRE-family HTH domain
MNTTTKFKTAAEAAADLAGRPEVAEAVKGETVRSQFVSLLVQMRLDKGITQEQVATSMGCDPSKISRMESGTDAQLRLSDIMGYTGALGIQAALVLDDETLPIATRIKHCVFQIDAGLKKLVQMAQEQDGNKEIANKISQFYMEVLFNFLKRYADNHEKLRSYIPLKGPTQPVECEVGDATEQSESEP